MSFDVHDIQTTAQAGFDLQNNELARAIDRSRLVVYSQTANGSANIAETFNLDRRFRLVFVRCHFTFGFGLANMTVSIDSALGPRYDAVLAKIIAVGTGADALLNIPGDENAEPSPWTFQAGDKIRIDWTNPASGVMTWGLAVGMALAA
ncbi:MAG: hypothetical protein IIB61_05165 [Planctomycetes bacterium]|nr:hypothetical protein [Planctomycetota bacterium]